MNLEHMEVGGREMEEDYVRGRWHTPRTVECVNRRHDTGFARVGDRVVRDSHRRHSHQGGAVSILCTAILSNYTPTHSYAHALIRTRTYIFHAFTPGRTGRKLEVVFKLFGGVVAWGDQRNHENESQKNGETCAPLPRRVLIVFDWLRKQLSLFWRFFPSPST